MSTSPVLEVRDLAIEFSHPRPAVNRISLHVDPGEILALVGESGSGKSMTARAVLGILPPGSRASGSVLVHGREVLGADERTLAGVRGRQVAMVFQEPQTALNPVRTVGWQLREALRVHDRRIGRKAARLRAIELLRDVEMPEPDVRVDHYPHQLSGGQKQRVVLALALANDPDLLLADEPTTALDVTVQAEILALLRRIRDRVGTSILLITHNMGVVAEMADRVVVLRTGDVVEEGSTAELFARPRHPYTQQLLGAVLRLPEQDTADVSVAVPRGGVEGTPALRLRDVSLVYPAHHGRPAFQALQEVSLDVRRGEVLGLIGESGSGKTTLGRAAAGLLAISAGAVELGGTDLGRASRGDLRRLRKGLAFVHQDPASSLDPRMTVATAVREPLDLHRVGDRASRDARVRELLDAVRLPGDVADRLPRELSGGQRQRVAFARALSLEPSLVVADEPTSALDVSVQEEVLALFSRLQQEIGFAALFISHDLAVVHHVADRVAVLRQGRVLEEGAVATVFVRPEHEYTRRLVDAVPVLDPARRPAPARRDELAS